MTRKDNERSCLSQDELSHFRDHQWKQAANSLPFQNCKSDRNNSKSARPLFQNCKVLFIPSLLFPEKSARLLLTQVKKNGGEAAVCQKGENGLKEAKEISAQESSSERAVLICADNSLIYKYMRVYELQYRPPKWLRECMRDMRFKDPSLYMKPGTLRDTGVQRGNGDVDSPKKASLKRPLSQSAVDSGRTSSSPFLKRAKTSVTASNKGRETHPDPSLSFSDKGASPSGETENGKIRVPRPQSRIASRVSAETSSREKRPSRWACEVRTSFSGTDFPMNDKICELLGVILESYQARKEHFRVIGYQRAIAKISALRHEVVTLADVRELSSGKGIGDRIEAKIMEIVTTGRLRQAEAVLENVENAAVRELCQVWGIGPVKALNLISHGIKSVKDLRATVKTNPNILDKNQNIGLRHYEDLLLRIPRKNVVELENFVRMIAKSVDPGFEIKVAGSYLRGKKDCGDVDIIVQGTESQLRGGFPKLINSLRRKGVLTDDLIIGGRKYFGVFRFPGRPHARVDLFAVPEHEFPFALLTYTGSAIFNRSMRAKARALGYSLSHKGIQRVNRGKHSKTRVEPPIQVKDEKEIFFLLDIPYAAPSARSI